jgi:hypothetical protein
MSKKKGHVITATRDIKRTQKKNQLYHKREQEKRKRIISTQSTRYDNKMIRKYAPLSREGRVQPSIILLKRIDTEGGMNGREVCDMTMRNNVKRPERLELVETRMSRCE